MLSSRNLSIISNSLLLAVDSKASSLEKFGRFVDFVISVFWLMSEERLDAFDISVSWLISGMGNEVLLILVKGLMPKNLKGRLNTGIPGMLIPSSKCNFEIGLDLEDTCLEA